MQAVESRDGIGVFLVALVVGQLVVQLVGDGHNLRGIVVIDLFVSAEAVDHILRSLVVPSLAFGCRPEEDVAVGSPDGLQLPGLARLRLVDEGHAGLEGRRPPIARAQHACVVARVVDDGLGIPQHRAFYVGHLLVKQEFGFLLMAIGRAQVAMLHGSLHVLADVERTLAGIVVPPSDERFVVGGLVAHFPVELRYAIVEPPLLDPQKHVGIQVVVVLKSAGVAPDGRTSPIAVDAKRRDAHLDPRLDVMHGLVHLLDKRADVVASPVVYIGKAVVVGVELPAVGNAHARHGVGVEVVVDVQSVDIVSGHDVLDDHADIVAVLRNAGIQDFQAVVVETTLRVPHRNMVVDQFLGRLGLGPIGVDPCVQLHASQMALLNHPLQGVPVGRWGSALSAGKETAPRLEAAGIERIALRTNLEDNGIDAIFLQLV